MNKPFITYPGGKAGDGVFQSIINRIPYHDIYVELFLGGGSIFAKKTAARVSILIDADTSVIQEWERMSLPPGSITLNTDAILWLENFKALASILKSLGLKVFIYADPPYPIFVRSSKRNFYRHEMTDLEHQKFLALLPGIDAQIMVSSYPNKLYNEMLQGWEQHTFTAQTRNKRNAATEIIYMNYPVPNSLHDYSYLGDDYRERESIKGRISRAVSKFKRMPDLQRNALIEQLKENKLI